MTGPSRRLVYFAKGANEPWLVATGVNGHPREALKLYDRRMTVEEQFGSWLHGFLLGGSW